MQGRKLPLPERLRLPGPVGGGQRREGNGLHQQKGHRGLRLSAVRAHVQGARPALRRRADGPIRAPGLLMDWNDPDSCAGWRIS